MSRALARTAATAFAIALAFAAPPPAVAQALAKSAVAIDIAAQPLAQALNELARQAGLQLLVAPELVAGKSAPTVKGSLSPREALKRLLAGSGLEAVEQGASVVVKQVAATAPAGALQAEATLAEVRVRASAEPLSGELPKAYAGGQVARGGRLGLLGDKDFMETPFSTANFTSDFIANQQARTVADVVKRDASVVNSSGPNQLYESFLVRGFPLFTNESAFNGLFGVVPVASVATESIERLELLKGPNAFLNGISPFGSIAGGLNIAPKRATAAPISRLTIDYAGDSLFGGGVDIGRRFGEQQQVGARLNALKRKGDTAIARQRSDAELVSLGVDWTRDRLRLSADLAYQKRALYGSQDSLELTGDFAPPPAPDNRSNWVQGWQNQTSEDSYGVLRAELDLTRNVTAFAAFGGRRSRYGELRNYQTLDNTQGDFTDSPYYGVEKTRTRSGEVGLRSSFVTGTVSHQVSAVVTRYRSRTAYSDYADVGAPVPSNIFSYIERAAPDLSAFDTSTSDYSGNTFTSYALSDTLGAFDEALQVTIGVRHQRVKSAVFASALFGGTGASAYDEQALTPALGIVVKPWNKVSLYANYIQGLSQGPTAPTGTANQGQVFPPYKSVQWEAGAKVDLGTLAGTVSVFQVAQPNGFTNQTTNEFGIDGEQRNRGLELSVFGQASAQLRLLGGVTLTHPKLTQTDGGLLDGRTAQGVPKLQAKIGSEWEVPTWKGFTLTSDITYRSRQYTQSTNTFTIPGYAVLDVGARYVFHGPPRFANDPMTLRVGLDNVFDKNYWASAYRGLSLGAPRRLHVALTTPF